jgi:hypothetical protein
MTKNYRKPFRHRRYEAPDASREAEYLQSSSKIRLNRQGATKTGRGAQEVFPNLLTALLLVLLLYILRPHRRD